MGKKDDKFQLFIQNTCSFQNLMKKVSILSDHEYLSFLERFCFSRKWNIKALFSLTSRFCQWNFLEWSFLIFVFCSSMNWVFKILNFHWQCSRSLCFSDMTNKKIKIFKFFWKCKLWEQASKVVRSIERWDTDALKCEKMMKFFFVMI